MNPVSTVILFFKSTFFTKHFLQFYKNELQKRLMPINQEEIGIGLAILLHHLCFQYFGAHMAHVRIQSVVVLCLLVYVLQLQAHAAMAPQVLTHVLKEIVKILLVYTNYIKILF